MRGGIVTMVLLVAGALLAPAAATAQGRGPDFYDSREVQPAASPLVARDGALTGPRAGAREDIARSYLRGKAGRLGLSGGDVDALSLAKRIEVPGGVTILRYGQASRGIPAFDGGVRVALDRAGRVLGVTGSPRADVAVPSVAPRLSAAEALRRAGLRRPLRVAAGPSGARRSTRFAGGEQARLTLFGGRLAWRVDFLAGPGEHFDAVVDAADGRLLWRANRVKRYAARVFDYYAGAPQGGETDRLQDLTGPGWLPADATRLSGPYAHAWSDIDDDNHADAGEEVARVGGDFQFTFAPFTANGPPRCTTTHLCSWDPLGDRSSWQDNRAYSTAQAFFLVNKFRDHLARPPIGFDAGSGAFGGTDPVLTQTFDGAATGPDADHVNNANMSTPPDGVSPTLQLYLFEYSDAAPFFDYDGVDAATVWHEYTHGLSNRLVVDEDGVGALNSPHAGAMGEAWSDWYAEDLIVREGWATDTPDADGEIDLGEPSDAVRHATRSEGIDCPVEDADAAGCPGGGYTLGDFGQIASGPEVHADGEIWAQTLWDVRAALVAATGSETAGSDEAEQLITMGMRLAPPEPSMLEMRDAILQADTANGGARHDLLWSAFAARGMGFYAVAFDGADVKPAEDFHVPPADGTPTGTLRGRVTDSATGAPLAGAVVRLGPGLADTTSADGTYEIAGITAGTYAKLAVRPGTGGYDPLDVPGVAVAGDATTTRDVALDRNWASKPGGASIASTTDNSGAPSCGANALIDDRDGGLGWQTRNDDSPATATIRLPRTVDVSAIGIDPAATCFDGASATLKGYRLEVSSDGSAFRPYAQGEFAPEQAGEVNRIAPTGDTGNDVRQVRLTLLSPQNECELCSGRDVIDVSALEVFGVGENVPPSGSLTATPAAAQTGQAVALDASSFTDPDTRIVSYAWDFDGNGSVDRTTSAATTSHAYATAGRFTPKVSVRDEDGAGTASTTVTVTAPAATSPPPPATRPPAAATPTALPTLSIARSGTKGRFTLRVACAELCSLSGKVTVSRVTARTLRRKRTTLTTISRTIRSTQPGTQTVRLPKALLRTLRARRLKSVVVTARFTVIYADGRKRTATRTLRIRR